METLRLQEPGEHAGEFFQGGSGGACVEETSLRSQVNPVLGLQQRASGYEEQPPSIWRASSSECLGDVCADRVGRAHELKSNRPAVEAPPRRATCVEVSCNADGESVRD